MTFDLSRRHILISGLALITAPAIVRASSLMPVRAPRLVGPVGTGVMEGGYPGFIIGSWLDKVAELYRISRRPGEDDFSLKARAFSAITPHYLKGSWIRP